MVYKRSIPTQICYAAGCVKVATEEVLNAYNAVIGRYCARHVDRALTEQIEAEARSMTRYGSVPRPQGTKE